MKLKKQQINFTQVANEVLNQNWLSAKAKGIYSYIYSKPDNWDFSIERIAKDFTDGVKSITSGIKELEEYGYLKRERQNNGRVIYNIYRTSQVEALTAKTAECQKGKRTKRQTDETEGVSNKEDIKNKEDISNKDTTTSSSESIDSKEIVEMEDKRNPDVQGIIDTIIAHHGTVDGKVKENRQYAYLLSEKIKKVPGAIEKFGDVTNFVHQIIENTDQYSIHKTTSPRKIYYELGGLIASIKARNTKNNTPKKKVSYG